MAHKQLLVALSLMVTGVPVAAGEPEAVTTEAAPAGTAETRYCLRIEAITGSRLEEVKCWTRQEWAENDVDVDKEWAKEGVSVIG